MQQISLLAVLNHLNSYLDQFLGNKLKENQHLESGDLLFGCANSRGKGKYSILLIRNANLRHPFSSYLSFIFTNLGVIYNDPQQQFYQVNTHIPLLPSTSPYSRAIGEYLKYRLNYDQY